MPDETLVFNGVNGANGSALLPGLTLDEIAGVALRETQDPAHLKELEHRHRSRGPHFGIAVDPRDLAKTGWGVIYSHADRERTPALREALRPLLRRRRQQAGELYRELDSTAAYRPGESKPKFLARHGIGPGPVDPHKLPYYLLLVGCPEAIPYRFQYQLDVQYAVGRIHFDEIEDYAHYASSVVAAENGTLRRSRSITCFGVANPDDRATQLSSRSLIQPLAKSFREQHSDWQVREICGETASKENLTEEMLRQDGPALLLTASHGVGFPKDHPLQARHQGALLCQEWPGPLEWSGQTIPDTYYLHGDDVDHDARPGGLLAFFFACYGAGTPLLDDFAHQAYGRRMEQASRSFVARLPQRLLSHPHGGALAVIGHVERAWGYSFQWPRAGRQLAVFEAVVKKLIAGHPVGSAMEFFDQRYAELSSDLAVELEEVEFGKEPDRQELAGMWTANNDARSYVVVGDPAVRLAV